MTDFDPTENTIVPVPQTPESLGGQGVLTESDMAALKAGTRRVALLMLDGCWHTPEEIRVAAGTNGFPASEGLRRLRELRAIDGVQIGRQRGSGRYWLYRLEATPPPPEPELGGQYEFFQA